MMQIFQLQYSRKIFQVLINRYSIFLLSMYLYVSIISLQGGMDSTAFFTQWVELIFLIYLYVYFYLILHPGRWRSLIAALPILVGYLVQDYYYLVYGKVFRLISALELPELVQIIPLTDGMLIMIFMVMPLIVFFSVINYRKMHIISYGALPLCLLTGLVVFSPRVYTDFVLGSGNGIVKYSDAKSVESNGRYTMMFYKEAERQSALNMTSPYRNRILLESKAEAMAVKLKNNGNYRNIHLIVLESFLDPRLFKRVRFTTNPVHPDFVRLFGENTGLSISPVFGGATAQAEFEVLCGVPALEKLSSVEFNVFSGAPVYCLPGLLDKAGYHTVATNAYKPNFFNAALAYKGTGFNKIYFPREYTSNKNSYFSVGDVSKENYMFDGDLLDQNLTFVAKKLKETPKTPIFNYVMTIYGHMPHVMDDVRRPEVIRVLSDYPDDHLQRSTNQFYYRTQAIANYVNALIKLDKNSLIILVSDHVPPLRNGPNTYRELNYMNNIAGSFYYNSLMIVENGKPIVFDDMRHFDIPDVIFNYITDGAHCREQPCAFLNKATSHDRQLLLDKYYFLMAHASE